MEFFLIAACVLFTFAGFMGLLFRGTVNDTRSVNFIVLMILLGPWLLHHSSLMAAFEQAVLNTDYTGDIPLILQYGGPIAMFLFVVVVCLLPGISRKILVILLPGSAFMYTWFITFPGLYARIGFINYDNVASIWLFVWLATVTVFLSFWRMPDRREIEKLLSINLLLKNKEVNNNDLS